MHNKENEDSQFSQFLQQAIIKSSPSHFRSKKYFQDSGADDSSSSSSDMPHTWFNANEIPSDENDIFSGPEVPPLRNYRRRSSRLLKKTHYRHRNHYNSSSPYCFRPAERARKNKKRLWSDFDDSTLSSMSEAEDLKRSQQVVQKNDPNQISYERVEWGEICGLEEHLNILHELVIWPLKFPEIFSRLSIGAAKGIIFYGPPGTGKTMVARALATLLSQHHRTEEKKVSFYSRSSSELLSKWIGEAEKGLRSLFHQARANSPSIIFFDEMDGLAPRRTAKQDQSHVSLVSTLLSLMDGLESRGNVVVIAATNRIEAIDPALLRPGRFDKELYFGLPPASVRKKMILKSINPASEGLISEEFINGLILRTEGFSCADLKALCTESIFSALRRLGGERWMSTISSTNFLETFIVNEEDWIRAYDLLHFKNSSGCSKWHSLVQSHSNLHHFDGLLSVTRCLFFSISETVSKFESMLMDWVNSAPIRLRRLVKLVSLDVYSLYTEGEMGISTPENKLVSIIATTRNMAERLATEEETLFLLYLPNLEKWKRVLKGSRCWSILRLFSSTFEDQKLRLLLSSESQALAKWFPNAKLVNL